MFIRKREVILIPSLLLVLCIAEVLLYLSEKLQKGGVASARMICSCQFNWAMASFFFFLRKL